MNHRWRQRPVCALLLLATCIAATPAAGSTIFVTITGVRNNLGHVRVAICSKADFLKPRCPYTGIVPASPGDVHVTIPNVPPGTYAAQAFHDDNDSGQIERSLLGTPRKAIGFSNDAKMFFGPPRFDAAAFTVAAAEVKITFALHSF